MKREVVRSACQLVGAVGLALLCAHVPASADESRYFYDDLGRLQRLERYEGVVVTYTYDAVGNRLSRMIIHDYDFDDVADSVDNCPQGYNPTQGPGLFAEMIVALSKTTFSWARPFDAEYVRGDLASVSTYATNDSGTLVAATSLTDTTAPTTGTGLYYLLKPGGGCANPSWQSSVGVEPGRDVSLP